ncbi:MAG: hypothetical protein RIR79_964 [Pseudomonadota bacterium]|jgi:chaperonin cofactor prefoldin
MSLSLEDIKGEFREGYQRTEEVLTGMDAYITRLEQRIAALEKQQQLTIILMQRIEELEAALYSDEADIPTSPKIYIG